MAGGGVKLTPHLHLVPKLGMSGAIPQLPYNLCLHGVQRHDFTFPAYLADANALDVFLTVHHELTIY